MQILGFNKTTLLDYPQHVAATIFLGGCNFRCPFCHNKDLVISPNQIPSLSMAEILTFLEKRKNILEGVCISGGEPTLSTDLPAFFKEIKALGYLIKLDTNGYNPDILIDWCNNGFIDYVAMDIKSDLRHYEQACGISNLDVGRIQASIDFLMKGTIPYEFRTTIVKELHTTQTIQHISQWIFGCTSYYLQPYVNSPSVLTPGFTSCTLEELESFIHILQKTIPCTSIRGTI